MVPLGGDDIFGANVTSLGDLICHEREIDRRLHRFIEFAHTAAALAVDVASPLGVVEQSRVHTSVECDPNR